MEELMQNGGDPLWTKVPFPKEAYGSPSDAAEYSSSHFCPIAAPGGTARHRIELLKEISLQAPYELDEMVLT